MRGTATLAVTAAMLLAGPALAQEAPAKKAPVKIGADSGAKAGAKGSGDTKAETAPNSSEAPDAAPAPEAPAEAPADGAKTPAGGGPAPGGEAVPAPAAGGDAAPPAVDGPPPVEFKDQAAPESPQTKPAPAAQPAQPPAGAAPKDVAPPPPAPEHLAPKSAVVLGARLAWFFPTGTMWHKAYRNAGEAGDIRPVDWTAFASSGPAFEVNAGVRLGRSYTVFAMWEHAFLGAGELDDDPQLGSPDSGSTDLYGAGLRFSTNPDGLGLVLEIGLGYRVFSSGWNSGASVNFEGDSISARLGIGANYRFSKSFTISPMLAIGSGTFGTGTITFPNGETRATMDRQQLDSLAQHVPIALQIGGHFDIPTSKDGE